MAAFTCASTALTAPNSQHNAVYHAALAVLTEKSWRDVTGMPAQLESLVQDELLDAVAWHWWRQLSSLTDW